MKTAAALLIVFAGLAAWSTGTAAPIVPARVQITSQEFTLTASRHVLKAGPAIVQLYNLGEDAHDLVVQQAGAKRPLGHIQAIPTDGVANLTLNLGPGRYLLYCSLPGHRALGMQTRFTVVKQPPAGSAKR
jgi:uncharacterized cupredoxin-like copper-binding protein